MKNLKRTMTQTRLYALSCCFEYVLLVLLVQWMTNELALWRLCCAQFDVMRWVDESMIRYYYYIVRFTYEWFWLMIIIDFLRFPLPTSNIVRICIKIYCQSCVCVCVDVDIRYNCRIAIDHTRPKEERMVRLL